MKKMKCPICLEKFKIKDTIETSCHHLFCENCFVGMLHKINKKCSLCRTQQTDWVFDKIVINSIEII